MKDLVKILLSVLVLTFAAVLLTVFLVGTAHAQTSGSCSWTILGSSFVGTQAQACAEAVTRVSPLVVGREPVSQTSCSLSGTLLSVGVLVHNPEQTYNVEGTLVGECGAAEPSAPAASAAPIYAVLLLPDFLNLSAEDGLLLSAAIVGVWAAAFFWRAAIRSLGEDNDGNSAI